MKHLTADRLREVLSYDPETGCFTVKKRTGSRSKLGDLAGYIASDGRRLIRVDGVSIRASRAAWLYVYGYLPDGDIDHINRNVSDNRICNLRVATRQQNMANKTIHKNNSSGFKGVHRHKETGKWRAQIRFNRKSKHIGLFNTKEEAHQAYLDAASRLFGEFATAGESPVK